jgi:DNA-binding NtrC family response regulator
MLSIILMREGKELLSRPVTDETITIGRSSDNTLQLIDPIISRTHCRVELKDGTPFITDVSRNGTMLNGMRISTSEVSEGDMIGIGPWMAKLVACPFAEGETIIDHHETTHVLSYDEGRKELVENRICLTALSPDQHPVRRSFSRGEIVIGSHATSDLAVGDNYVSREHCKLMIRRDALILMDLGSTNGTFIDGVRIERIALSPEGTFTIGKTTVRYQRKSIVEKVAPSAKNALGAMLGASREMREVFSLISKIAPTDIPICIHGESGTGKELAAREIHALSGRRDKPFIAINCGALPATIIESMLFGHERGAFTGAVERQVGVFEQAHGGTLFLDEISEMETNLQPRLLRVLEEGTVRRLGAKEEQSIDVRIIVATNKDLKQLVRANAFREDLFYRLYVLPLYLPPLRERRDDIPHLARHFVERHSPVRRPLRLTAEAMSKLEAHEWPGNVRELKNTLVRAMIAATGETIEAGDIQFMSVPRVQAHDASLNNHEREAIIDALRKAGGNQTKAARLLGIARTTVAYKIGRYGINMKNL